MNVPYNLPNIISYLGVIATILFGIWSIYVAIKNRFFVRMTFVLRKSIALFDTIVKNIPELSIYYDSSPISESLILIEGALVNTGTKDILPTMIEKPICLNLPEKYKWLKAKIISSSINVKADTIMSDETLTITSGLLKRNEYIRFQALLQAPHDINISKIENKMHKIINFSHRIADMSKIKSILLVDINKKHIIYACIMLLIIAILFGSMGYSIATTEPVMETVYSFEKSNKEYIKVIISKVDDSEVTIKSIDNSFNATLPGKQFFKKGKKVGEIEITLPGQKIIPIVFVIMAIGCLILEIGILRIYKMYKSLFQSLSQKQ